MSATGELSEFCASLSYEDLSPEVVDRCKQVLLDTTGIAVGSVRAESTPSVLGAIAENDPGTAGDGATILGTGERATPAYAALANGTLAHSLDYDETHRAGSVHAAAPVLAGGLAAGEPRAASGESLLTAFAGGYEVTARLGMALNSESHYAKGFHGTSTCGVFGAAAAIGIIRGFDQSQLGTTFGINGSQASGSLQFLENGSWNKRIHPGLAAHSAMLAASLTGEGFFAARDPIEGNRGFLQAYSDDPRPRRATEGLGEGFEVMNTGLKPYPLCRFLHPAIDLLIGVATENDLDPATVERVTVRMSTSGANIVGDPRSAYPESVVDAQFSMPFAAMLALTRREAGVEALYDAFEGGAVEFSETERRLMDVTTTESADWADDLYPDKWATEVCVETTDETFRRRLEDARGDPQTPLSWDELRSKFRELTHPVLGADAAETLRERIEGVEEHTVDDLLAPIRAADPSWDS